MRDKTYTLCWDAHCSCSALQLQLDVTSKAGLARAFYLVNKQAVRAATAAYTLAPCLSTAGSLVPKQLRPDCSSDTSSTTAAGAASAGRQQPAFTWCWDSVTVGSSMRCALNTDLYTA
jgi:hypothetical protein